MKKLVCIIVFLAALGNFSMTFAEEFELPQDQKTVATLMLIKQNWIAPEHGDGFFKEGITLWWHHQSNIGFGIDIDLTPKTNYQRYLAYINYNHDSDPWYPLVGVSTDSLGKDFIQTGLWYFKKHGQTEVFVDERIYWSVNGKSDTYSELFVEVIYPIVKDVKIGINACFDHWFSGSQHNWWMTGPIVYFDNLLGAGVTPYVRVAYESDVRAGQKNSNAIDVRIALKLAF